MAQSRKGECNDAATVAIVNSGWSKVERVHAPYV